MRGTAIEFVSSASGGAEFAIVASMSTSGFDSGAGVSSTVLCFPVVHGGMDRNSSNVSTRGLQHRHPTKS